MNSLLSIEIMLTVDIDDGVTTVRAGDTIVLSCNLTTGGRAPDVEWRYYLPTYNVPTYLPLSSPGIMVVLCLIKHCLMVVS